MNKRKFPARQLGINNLPKSSIGGEQFKTLCDIHTTAQDQKIPSTMRGCFGDYDSASGAKCITCIQRLPCAQSIAREWI